MKIQCPKCRSAAPADQVNMANDLAFCPRCNEGFKVSESVDMDSYDETVLFNPPKGTWYREGIDGHVIGATTRSAAAFFLVPFMCVWSGVSLGGIYGSQIVSGKFNLGISLFGIPFLLGSILFWAIALMTICGKTEVKIGPAISYVFVGIGNLGWRRPFNWYEVKTIREEISSIRQNNRQLKAIALDGQQKLRFGTGLTEKRRYFMLNTLKCLKAKTG
jgi:hypothetical protein